MKYLLTLIAFGVFILITQITQAQILNSPEIGNSIIEIPEDLRSRLVSQDTDGATFRTHSKYNEKINGYVNITMDKQGFIIKIIAPNSVNNKVLINKNIAPCPHCLPYSENTGCILSCLYNTIFN